MVAAGVYLVGRFFPVFTAEVLLYIAYTGGITLFIAATIAMVQTDYKKVLAYSTVSQLGFMMLAWASAAGRPGCSTCSRTPSSRPSCSSAPAACITASTRMRCPRWAACSRRCRSRRWTMLVGTLAISGVPFFSGFYSKDAILAAALARVQHEPRALHAVPAAGGRRGAHGVLHVPDVVLDLRRRAAGFPVDGRGRSLTRSRRRARLDTGARHRPWPRPRPRPQPGRPRPRERADHDLAADHPGGLQHLRRLDALGTCIPDFPFGDADPGAHARIRRAVPALDPTSARACTIMRLASSFADHADGDRAGPALLRSAGLPLLRADAT